MQRLIPIWIDTQIYCVTQKFHTERIFNRRREKLIVLLFFFFVLKTIMNFAIRTSAAIENTMCSMVGNPFSFVSWKTLEFHLSIKNADKCVYFAAQTTCKRFIHEKKLNLLFKAIHRMPIFNLWP